MFDEGGGPPKEKRRRWLFCVTKLSIEKKSKITFFTSTGYFQFFLQPSKNIIIGANSHTSGFKGATIVSTTTLGIMNDIQHFGAERYSECRYCEFCNFTTTLCMTRLIIMTFTTEDNNSQSKLRIMILSTMLLSGPSECQN